MGNKLNTVKVIFVRRSLDVLQPEDDMRIVVACFEMSILEERHKSGSWRIGKSSSGSWTDGLGMSWFVDRATSVQRMSSIFR